MFDRETAEKKAAELINADYHAEDDELVIVSEETIEKDYGWIFFYQSRKYLETGEFGYILAGNGPVAFEKASGLIHHLGSHAHPHELIRQFEAKRAARQEME
jgi:Immunity protein 35